MNKLIAISGKSQVGKDEVGKIIQKLAPQYINKKFADKIKDIVCLLLGCIREDLENEEFKNKELGEEWWYYTNTLFYNKEKVLIPYMEANNDLHNNPDWYIIKMTPRLLLQLIGTDCGREMLHPNLWINSTFVDYKQIIGYAPGNYFCICGNCKTEFIGHKRAVRCEKCSIYYPAWYITDCRFPNEAKAIKDRKGIIIRVVRPCKECSFTYLHTPECSQYTKSQHISETALDDYKHFDYTVINNSSLEHLEKQIKEILIKEGILC